METAQAGNFLKAVELDMDRDTIEIAKLNSKMDFIIEMGKDQRTVMAQHIIRDEEYWRIIDQWVCLESRRQKHFWVLYPLALAGFIGGIARWIWEIWPHR
jgi:hypothetical protein